MTLKRLKSPVLADLADASAFNRRFAKQEAG